MGKKKSGGKDSLKVSNITVALKKPNEKSTSAMFICPTYSVAASDTVKRNTCTLDRSSSVSCSSSGSRPSSPSRSPSPPDPHLLQDHPLQPQGQASLQQVPVCGQEQIVEKQFQLLLLRLSLDQMDQ